MSQSAFEQYLKNSDYFRDVVNTNRRATAEVVAAVLIILREQNQIADPVINQTLKRLNESTSATSIDVERRRIVALIRDSLKSLK